MKLKLKEFVFENEVGSKVKLSFDGSFSPEDIGKIIKKLQDDDTPSESHPIIEQHTNSKENEEYDTLSIREKLELIVKEIKYGWFTSDHIRELYFYHFREEIKPSTVSTYRARMFTNTILERRGTRARREYRVSEKPTTTKSDSLPSSILSENPSLS